VQRRDFLNVAGLGLAGVLLPHSRSIAAEALLEPVDTARRRRLADAALNTARSGGAQ
jgi:TldD protein